MALGGKKKAFALAYCETGGCSTEAARQAGYSDGCARTYGSRLSRDPAVLEFIVREYRTGRLIKFGVKGFEAAVKVMENTTDPKIILQAASILINASGLKMPEQVDVNVTTDKRTDSELDEVIRRASEALIRQGQRLPVTIDASADYKALTHAAGGS